jgi:hypothetical protein
MNIHRANVVALEGPATHLCQVSIVCRSYKKKPDLSDLQVVTAFNERKPSVLRPFFWCNLAKVSPLVCVESARSTVMYEGLYQVLKSTKSGKF